jgi:hypothetical protein
VLEESGERFRNRMKTRVLIALFSRSKPTLSRAGTIAPQELRLWPTSMSGKSPTYDSRGPALDMRSGLMSPVEPDP